MYGRKQRKMHRLRRRLLSVRRNMHPLLNNPSRMHGLLERNDMHRLRWRIYPFRRTMQPAKRNRTGYNM